MWFRLGVGLVLCAVVGCSSHDSEPAVSQGLGVTPFLYYPLDEFFGGVSCDWDCYYNANGSPHAALDLRTGAGKQTVRAAADGWLAITPNNGGCGNMATITHSSGYKIKYCHFSSYVGGARQVVRGEAIGKSGATGWTDPPGYDHVHFQVLGSNGAPVHPGCPPGIPDSCNDASSSMFWVTHGGTVVRASERRANGLDFDGDGCEDMVARSADARLRLYAGNCASGYAAENVVIGTSFDDFDRLLSPGDWNGDGCADIVGRRASDESLRLYAGNCQSGYAIENQLIGSSWDDFDQLFSPGDFSGDGCSDLIGRRRSDATLRLYAGNCQGGYAAENVIVGTRFDDFDVLLGARDWDGDGCADIIGRRKSDATLRLYAGNCASGYTRENVLIGTSFAGFDRLVAKDWSGDGCTDLIARDAGGRLLLYTASCNGGWQSEAQVIGTGWSGMNAIF